MTEICGQHPLVLLKDDPVPDAERLGADPELVAQLTRCLAAGPDHVVECCDIGPADGQECGCLVTSGVVLRRLGMMDRPPVLDHLTPGLVDGASDGYPAVVGVSLNGGGDVAFPQCNEGISLPLLVGPGLVDIRAELVERACPHHGRLVYDDHVPGSQPTAFAEIGQELGE